MSADNWAVCPRCKFRHAAKYRDASSLADASYGKVSRDEWAALEDAANALSSDLTEQTLREDYEIYGAGEGTVRVRYRGLCGECGLAVAIDHSHVIQGIEE